MATTTREAPSGTASVRGTNGRGTASWIRVPRTMEARYTSGGRTIPRLGTSCSAIIAIQEFEIGLKLSAHSFFVILPRSTENSFQLPFFPTDKEIHQGNVNRSRPHTKEKSERQQGQIQLTEEEQKRLRECPKANPISCRRTPNRIQPLQHRCCEECF